MNGKQSVFYIPTVTGLYAQNKSIAKHGWIDGLTDDLWMDQQTDQRTLQWMDQWRDVTTNGQTLF